MDCTHANDLIGPWMDGELDAGDRAALDAHLAECAECRATADALRLQDANLRRAFAGQRAVAEMIATRVIEQLDSPDGAGSKELQLLAGLRGTEVPPYERELHYERIEERSAQPRVAWLPLLAAMAAGFLLAVVVFRPWEGPRVVVKEVIVPPEHSVDTDVDTTQQNATDQKPPEKASITLAVATGPVEVLPARQTFWMTCPSNEPVDTGATLRTGPDVRCEFATPEGSQIRLNAETEVRVSDQRQFELTKGQLWSCVRQGQPPLAVRAANTTISAQEAQFDLAKQNGEAVLTVVEGTATVRDRQGERTVEAGQRVTLVDGKVAEDRRALDALLDTSWVHEVLLLKGSDDPEYIDRMNRLLARIGEAKLSILYEEEIRRQGDACVAPLMSYMQSEQAREQTDKRRRAARIVADVAQPRSIPDLVHLLSDEDPLVRRSAAEGLLRLTGHDHGRPPAEWQTETWAGCQPTVKQWHDWLERQRDRIPGAQRPKDSKQIQYKKA